MRQRSRAFRLSKKVRPGKSSTLLTVVMKLDSAASALRSVLVTFSKAAQQEGCYGKGDSLNSFRWELAAIVFVLQGSFAKRHPLSPFYQADAPSRTSMATRSHKTMASPGTLISPSSTLGTQRALPGKG